MFIWSTKEKMEDIKKHAANVIEISDGDNSLYVHTSRFHKDAYSWDTHH